MRKIKKYISQKSSIMLLKKNNNNKIILHFNFHEKLIKIFFRKNQGLTHNFDKNQKTSRLTELK